VTPKFVSKPLALRSRPGKRAHRHVVQRRAAGEAEIVAGQRAIGCCRRGRAGCWCRRRCCRCYRHWRLCTLVILLKAPLEVKAIVVAPAGPARPIAKALASIIVRVIGKSSEWFAFVSITRTMPRRLFSGLAAFIITTSLSCVKISDTCVTYRCGPHRRSVIFDKRHCYDTMPQPRRTARTAIADV